ncbi:Uncharacterized membrane protein YgdD, TMEM256/DUF423 family [Seinonella peptonophila]|uniref:Uncharacterized membrane protein YgdD, TMEM256/DUF423 family n=1 Tax=Seinonella peptonophila TaxID=112248 RepID=A0A1M4WB46_9BACL|nr:DUF423 domain-containing protein [Seinonella peptonophila]SHE78380.1 Uncharacterized membrane protein YgdD, TMEM256/DUF423 family [Seinonella peptonophila]
MKTMIILGSINMAFAIALGAFGAHGLEGRVSERMIANWQTGAHYHLIHALAIVVVGLLFLKAGIHTSWLSLAGWTFFAGILFFSGSLYLMALTGVTKLGMITPIGGVAFIVGWIFVTIFASKYVS